VSLFSSIKNFFLIVFISLASVGLFMILAEVLLRIVGAPPKSGNLYFLLNPELDYPQFFKRDHKLFWKFRPNQVIHSNFIVEGEYRINSFGLRNKEFSLEKPKSSFRIVCLGNSNTFGWKQSEQDAYPLQLQQLFDQNLPGQKIEFINAGITGYSSYQGKNFLREDILGFKPDLILINYGWNDLLPAKFGIPDKEQKMPPQWILNIQNLLSRTRLYQLLKSFWVGRFSGKKGVEPGISRVSLEDFQQNLIEIEQTCQKNNIQAIFLTNPVASLEAYWGPGKVSKVHLINQAYNDAIRQLGQTHNFKVIDIAPLFENRKDLYDHPQADYIHYNALGHKLVARTLYGYLLSHGLITTPAHQF
jgi:lysophospholipase L1-like esterase